MVASHGEAEAGAVMSNYKHLAMNDHIPVCHKALSPQEVDDGDDPQRHPHVGTDRQGNGRRWARNRQTDVRWASRRSGRCSSPRFEKEAAMAGSSQSSCQCRKTARTYIVTTIIRKRRSTTRAVREVAWGNHVKTPRRERRKS